MLFATTLSTRQRELLVLRVAAVRDSAYEWAQHVVLADDVGLTADEIARIEEGPGCAGVGTARPGDGRRRRRARPDATVFDETWAVLAAELDDQQLMDLVFTVGAYDVLAMALRTFGVPLDDDLIRKLPSP